MQMETISSDPFKTNHTLAKTERELLLIALRSELPFLDLANELLILSMVVAANMCILVYRYTNEETIALHFSPIGLQGDSLQVSVTLQPEMTVFDVVKVIEKITSKSIMEAIQNAHLRSISDLIIGLNCCESNSEVTENTERSLQVSCIEEDDGLICTIAITKLLLFGLDEDDYIVGHWNTLFKAFTQQTNIPISHIDILPTSEVEFLTSSTWSSTPPVAASQIPWHQISPPNETFLHTIFENTARMHSNRTAILYEDSKSQTTIFTYQDIESISTQFAYHLYENYATGPGKFIGLLMPQVPAAYIAMLAILKTGSAYVPIDPTCPIERVDYILKDSGAELLLTERVIAESQGFEKTLTCQTIFLEDCLKWEISSSEDFKLPAEILRTSDVAYMIYTSGTTGRPKGVAVEHQNAVNLIQAEYHIFGLHAEDRVYQQFSLAFDASIEEIWLPFMVGGTLVPATQRPGPGLSDILEAKGVTVLSCVPTLLSMLSEEEKLPSLRLLILGGEACPKTLVERFSTKCRVVNSYGPTEATVIATWKECHSSDNIVTIGRPIPGYSAFILSVHGQLQPLGAAGELVIGGRGVTRCYQNQPELTNSKFIQNKLLTAEGRLYRTGDLARFTSDGEIEYLGRIDTQVKLRGYRIELAEIESTLLHCEEIQGAVVNVHVDSFNVEQLVAYIILNNRAKEYDEEVFKEYLKKTMPSYMVPTVFQVVEEFPTLPSGKVDRKNLPQILDEKFIEKQDSSKVIIAPRTPTEAMLVEIWSRYFVGKTISISDNFFALGGHSLFAAMLVSELRKSESTRGISMSHIYQYDTLEKLAHTIDSGVCSTTALSKLPLQSPERNEGELNDIDIEKLANSDRASFPPIPGYIHAIGLFICQILAISTVFVVTSLPISILYILYKFTDVSIVVILFVFILDFFWMSLIAITLKWILIGRYRPGRWPVWGYYYWRWWVIQRIMGALKLNYLEGSPLLNIFYILMGARVNMTAYIGTQHVSCFDLLTIEDEASIGLNAYLLGYKVEDGWLIIGTGIHVGAGARVGNRSNLGLNSQLEERAMLDDVSALQENERILKDERWGGSPAKFVENIIETDKETTDSFIKLWFCCLLHFITVAFLNGTLGLLPTLTSIIVLEYTPVLFSTINPYVTVVVTSPFVAIISVILFCLVTALLKCIVLPRISPGEYKLRSIFYIRKWSVDVLMQISLDMINSIYGTLYAPHWLRTLGANIGQASEVSTVTYISPNLLTIGNGCFVADTAVVGPPCVYRGCITIDRTVVGDRSFIGNSALLPSGVAMGKDCLLGVLSTPGHNVKSIVDNSSWLGSPALFLPIRQAPVLNWPKERTYNPTNWLYVTRYSIEFWRVFLPNIVTVTLMVTLTVVIEILYQGSSQRNILPDVYVNGLNGLFDQLSQGALISSFIFIYPILSGVIGICGCCFVLIMKWALIGVYTKREVPLWSSFVWRTELATALQEGIANKMLIQNLRGTSLLCVWFRLLGSKIGKRVWMDTWQISEADLIDIEDDVSIGTGVILQTHLFEDRIMKLDKLKIGNRCNVQSASVILYGANLEDSVSIGRLSLVMKGESLPSNSSWAGIPLKSYSEDNYLEAKV
ncbi:hypothetical protein K7432_005843 [Basidiobolus ranarum]|uniref:Carrier domain-containing protein n=1 Tax=Basidiobolus ranarum TaxID=34480 RepID=A0ABR2WVT7_9FUNG